MHTIEIKEIFSSQNEHYKKFLEAALEADEESLLITNNDIRNLIFPTRDRMDSFTLGAYVDNVLAGVVSFARDGEDREKLRHKGLLSTMYVSKEFRGLGIAKKLLEEVINRVKAVRDIEQINLIVIATNAKAKPLYEQFGFVRFGTESNSIKWKNSYYAEDHMVLRIRRNGFNN